MDTQVITPKLSELEKQQMLEKQLRETYQIIARIMGTTEASLTIYVTMPENKYEPWMEKRIEQTKAYLAIVDDSLPF